jgi:leader peptidase (prepilin peptidase)/N-methyltransferase
MEFTVLATLPAWLLLGFSGALGLVIGSFLNVVIYRLPRGESLSRPGSHCPGCGEPVAWYDNIPVFAFLWLRGRCRRCGEGISLRYPAVELLVGVLFVAIAVRHGLHPMTFLWWAFGAALVAAAAIDFDHQIIPDEISLGGLVVALVAVPCLSAVEGAVFLDALRYSLVGALLGGGSLWLVGFVHARVSSLMGRHFAHWPGEGEELPTPRSLDYWVWFPGVGFGDVKLLAMIGAVLGPMGVLETILLASVSGLVLGLSWAVATRRLAAPFGFGPAIAAGALVVLLVPDLLGALYELQTAALPTR